MIALGIAMVLETALVARAQSAPTPATTLDAAVAQLIVEADNLFPVKLDAKDQPQFTRPHAVAIKTLIGKPGVAREAAKRIAGKLTNDPIRDMYIRWHLIPLILMADDADAK